MQLKNLISYENNAFEKLKRIDEHDNEYWETRELQVILEHKQWRNFELVINKAKLSCENSNDKVYDHFADVSKMVKTGDSTKKHYGL